MTRPKASTRLAALSILACAALALSACSGGSAAAGGELDMTTLKLEASQASELTELYNSAIDSGNTEVTIYAGHHDEFEGMYSKFEERFPGITITPETYVGADLQTTLEAERQSGKHTAGVISNPNADRYAEQGFAEAYTPVTFSVPSWTEGRISPDQIKDPKGFYFSPWALFFSSSYNTNEIQEAELPGTWAELADPKWDGKITFMNPSTPGGTMTVLTTLLDAGVVDKEWLTTVGGHAKIVAQDQLALQSIISGEFAFQPLSAATSVLNAKKDGAPVEVHFMDEDNAVATEKWMLAANGPSPEASKLLMNYLFTAEAQEQTLAAGNFPIEQDPSITSPHGWPTLEDSKFVELPKQSHMREAMVEYADLFKAIAKQ